jgi:PAS domain S-box-containing protein
MGLVVESEKLEKIEQDVAEIKNSMADFKKTKELLNRFLEGERKYRSLYEGSPDMYRTINTEGIVIDCNNAYAKNLGYTKKDVVGGSIFEHVIDRDLNAMRDSFETWLATGEVKNREVWFQRKDGTAFPALISATSIYDEAGDLVGSNTIIRDISEIHKAKQRVSENSKYISELSDNLKEAIKQLAKFKGKPYQEDKDAKEYLLEQESMPET